MGQGGGRGQGCLAHRPDLRMKLPKYKELLAIAEAMNSSLTGSS